MPVVIGVLGLVKKGLGKYMEKNSWSGRLIMGALDSTNSERRKTLITIINNQLHVSSLLMGLFRNIKCNKNLIKMEYMNKVKNPTSGK